MTVLLSTLLAALPRAFMFLLAKLLTEDFLQDVLAKIIIAGLKHAVKLTKNTVDDELVAEVEKRLKA